MSGAWKKQGGMAKALWYQSHSFLAGDSVVVFSVSPSVSTRNFSAQLLYPLLTVVGATLVVK